jgi:hypothetical protein
MGAPFRGEAAAYARPPSNTMFATFGIAAKTKQIVLKEIRARWGELPVPGDHAERAAAPRSKITATLTVMPR